MTDRPTGYICTPRVYAYKGIEFEYGAWGMAGLCKDGTIRTRDGPKWWATFDEWLALPEEEREKYREDGGCIRI